MLKTAFTDIKLKGGKGSTIATQDNFAFAIKEIA